jgi:hypothetical protein
MGGIEFCVLQNTVLMKPKVGRLWNI